MSCSGAVTIYGHQYRCWLKGGHGGMALTSAIEQSCDTYFYRLAQDAGLERLAAWATLFGLGRATGIELAGESSGLVPSDAWSRRARGHPWYGGETISVGIGQGPILATPLQLAVAYAALVNGGFLVTPHLDAASNPAPQPLNLDPQVLATVRHGMELVVGGDRGTARRWSNLPARFAGKTGTSQVIRKVEGVKWFELPWEQRHHALFVAYAPPEAPTLVVAVVVEHGGDAGAVAAPVAARVIQRAFAPGFDTTTIKPNIPEGLNRLPADTPDESNTLETVAAPAAPPPITGGAPR